MAVLLHNLVLIFAFQSCSIFESQALSTSNLKTFISNKSYGSAKSSPKLTVEWYPPYSDTTVNVSCITRIQECFVHCEYYYLNCLNCYSWKPGFKWEKSTVAAEGERSAVFAKLPLDEIKENQLILACSISLVKYTDYWSTPIILNQEKDSNPPPRLAVAGTDSQGNSYIYLYDASFIGASNELGLISKQQQQFESSIDFQSSASTSGEPKFITADVENQTIDFCINWINGKRYEIRNIWVDGEINSSKIVEVNQYDKEENTVYDAGENVTLHQLVCQPIQNNESENILAWSQTNLTATNDNVTSIRITHPIGSLRSQDVLKNCSKETSCKKLSINSTALAMDLTANRPRLVFLNESGDIIAVDWKQCNCSVLAGISLNTKKNNLSHLAVDKSYVYMVVNGELKLVPRDYYSDTVYSVDLGDDVHDIIDILAVSPDLQPSISEEEYFPQLDSWNVTMVTPSVAEVNISLKWASDSMSERPPYSIEIQYGKVDDNTSDACPNVGCRKIKTGFDFQKSTNATLLVTNLEYGSNYWFEVQVRPLNSYQYETDYQGPSQGQNFYSQFTESSQGYGYTSESDYGSETSSESSTVTSASGSGSKDAKQEYSYDYQKKAGNSKYHHWLTVCAVLIAVLTFLF